MILPLLLGTNAHFDGIVGIVKPNFKSYPRWSSHLGCIKTNTTIIIEKKEFWMKKIHFDRYLNKFVGIYSDFKYRFCVSFIKISQVDISLVSGPNNNNDNICTYRDEYQYSGQKCLFENLA